MRSAQDDRSNRYSLRATSSLDQQKTKKSQALRMTGHMDALHNRHPRLADAQKVTSDLHEQAQALVTIESSPITRDVGDLSIARPRRPRQRLRLRPRRRSRWRRGADA